jgi:hypothetical protein
MDKTTSSATKILTLVELGLDQCLIWIEAKLDDLLGLLKGPQTHYSTGDTAEILGVTDQTVRVWCRHGRVNAIKRQEQKGAAELWSITVGEIQRYKDEGLLPMDLGRNRER